MLFVDIRYFFLINNYSKLPYLRRSYFLHVFLYGSLPLQKQGCRNWQTSLYLLSFGIASVSTGTIRHFLHRLGKVFSSLRDYMEMEFHKTLGGWIGLRFQHYILPYRVFHLISCFALLAQLSYTNHSFVVHVGLTRSEKTFLMSTPKRPGAQIFRFTQLNQTIDPPSIKLSRQLYRSNFQIFRFTN